MPKYQGYYDGLCGPYAVMNALELCDIEPSQELFKCLCGSLNSNRWPAALWEGTTFLDLKRMVSAAQRDIPWAFDVIVSYPFEKETPRTPAAYWQRMDRLYEESPGIVCTIMGMTRPSNHRIVSARNSRKRLTFTDSDPFLPSVRKNQSSIHPGSKNGNPNKWIVDRAELIVFEQA